MVCAGFLFDIIVAWPVFIEITEIIIMIPALLGLGLVLGSLVATQAVLVGVINQEEEQPFKLDHAIILLSSAMLTASIASVGLGAVMAVVVIASRKLNINPDNMAIPIAEALGDITSLGLMAVLASCLHVDVSEGRFTAYVIIGCYAVVAPVSGYIAWRNCHTRPVMMGGWVPILAAMTISFVAGVILEPAVLQFVIIKRFQTVFNGVGGQLASIQASRISTALHSAEIHENRKCGAQDDRESMGDAKTGNGSATSFQSDSASPSTPRTDLKKKISGSTSSPPSYTSPQPSDGGTAPSITSPPPSYTSPLPSYTSPPPAYTSPLPTYSSVKESKPDNCPIPSDNVSTSSPPAYLPSGDTGSPSRISPFKTNINTSTPIRRSSPAIFPNEISHMTSDGDSHPSPNQLFCCGSSSDSSTGRLLLLLVLPGQCLFLYLFVLLKNDQNPSSLFVALFLLASLLQVSILIQISQMMVHWFWSKGWDPDSSAIPYLTALGDLLGVSLLTATCFLLQWLGDDYVIGEDASNDNITTTTHVGDYTDFATTHSINYDFNT